MNTRILWTGLLVVAMAACGSTDGGADGGGSSGGSSSGGSSSGGSSSGGEVSGSIKESTTWSGNIHVVGDVLVQDDAVLTIEKGTVITVDAERRIVIGYANKVASIQANGTKDAPITFKGKKNERGFWRGLDIVKNATSDSVLKHVNFENGGAAKHACLKLSKGITVQDVTVTGCGAVGVEASDFKDGSKNLKVVGGAKAAVRLNHFNGLHRLPEGSYDGNDEDFIEIAFTNITGELNVRNPGIPLLNMQDVLSKTGAKITIGKGVQWKSSVDRRMEFGYANNETLLKIDGTSDEPVIFSGKNAEKGFWQGIRITKNVSSSSYLRHVHILDTGAKGHAALRVYAAVELSNVALKHGAKVGLELTSQGLAPKSSKLIVTDVAGPAVLTSMDGAITLPDGEVEATDKNWVSINSGSLTKKGSLHSLGVPYRVDSDILLKNGSSLTVEAGVKFVFPPSRRMEVGYANGEATFIVSGTTDNPVVFEASDPKPGHWKGVSVRKTATSASKIENATFQYGGQKGGANLTLLRDVAVKGCMFKDSAGFGLMKTKADTTDYKAGNSFSGNAEGDIGTY